MVEYNNVALLAELLNLKLLLRGEQWQQIVKMPYAATAKDEFVKLAEVVAVLVEVDLQRAVCRVNGLLVVLEEASKAGCKKVVLASSAAIYGDNPVVPKVETMYPEPKSPYGITKLDGEYYMDMFRTTGQINTGCCRFFNVFGPRQDPKGAYAAAVPIFMEKALKGEDITVFGDGEQTRDFIYVKDIVGALAYVAEHPEVTGVNNVGYGGQITINDLAEIIIKAAGSTSKVVHLPERPGDVKHSRACADKLRGAGWEPKYTLEEGLKTTLEYFKSVTK